MILDADTRDQGCDESCINVSNSPIVLEDLSALNVTKFSPEVEELKQKVII